MVFLDAGVIKKWMDCRVGFQMDKMIPLLLSVSLHAFGVS